MRALVTEELTRTDYGVDRSRQVSAHLNMKYYTISTRSRAEYSERTQPRIHAYQAVQFIIILFSIGIGLISAE